MCEQGCGCLSVLALRKPNNCKVIMESGGALAAVQAMKAHSDAVNVQVSEIKKNMLNNNKKRRCLRFFLFFNVLI